MEKTATVKSERVLISDLPDRKDLIGQRVNVRRQGGKYHYEYQSVPMMRIFLGARTYTEKGIKWVEWSWKPEETNEDDHFYNRDCGYSAIGMGSENLKGSYLNT